MKVDVLKIKSLMLYNQVTQADLAKIMGVTENTLRSRFKNPETFNLEEMNMIIKVLKIENPAEVFFA